MLNKLLLHFPILNRRDSTATALYFHIWTKFENQLLRKTIFPVFMQRLLNGEWDVLKKFRAAREWQTTEEMFLTRVMRVLNFIVFQLSRRWKLFTIFVISVSLILLWHLLLVKDSLSASYDKSQWLILNI